MDIEGYEYNAILGAKETLVKWKPALIVEVHSELLGRPTTIELLELLKSLGYEAISLVPRGWDYPMLNKREYIIRTNLDAVIRNLRSGKRDSKFKTFTLYLK
jgi:hypothetical protein